MCVALLALASAVDTHLSIHSLDGPLDRGVTMEMMVTSFLKALQLPIVKHLKRGT
jgi:hypothetical protein